MGKSKDATALDNAIRDANIRASNAHADNDDSALADASTDLHELRMMRLSLNEIDE